MPQPSISAQTTQPTYRMPMETYNESHSQPTSDYLQHVPKDYIVAQSDYKPNVAPPGYGSDGKVLRSWEDSEKKPFVPLDRKKEHDPNGTPPSLPGAKLDGGKVDILRGCIHYFSDALHEVARLSEIGARKYSWKGWESVPDGINRYGAALGRHLAAEARRDYDPDTGVLEATAVAWNALARLQLMLKEKAPVKPSP